MKRFVKFTLFLFTLLIFTGCHHKDLCYGSAESKVIKVVFDWRDAPDAMPGSMALYLYPLTGGTPLRYEFSGRDGGTIRVPYGKYDALCMNSDNVSWAHISDTDSKYTFGIHVGELTEVSESEESEYASVLKQGGKSSDGNPVDENPKGLWTGSFDAFEVFSNPNEQTLTIVPEDALCYYTVDVIDVEGLEDISEEGIPAMLTGMSDGVDALSRNSSTIHISSPFILQPATRSNALHAEFCTFGEDKEAQPIHKLQAMIELADGTWQLQSTDVTDQVHEAPDARHVHIVVKGLKVPHSTGGGLKVDVDEWESENITLKM